MPEHYEINNPSRPKPRRGFHFFTGDLSWLAYRGVWSREISPNRFHFITLDNMDEACGRDNEGRPTYHIQLSEVDLDEVPPSELANAMQCSGMDRRDTMTATAEQVAEMVRSYGVSSPLHSEATNNAHKGITACRAESYRLTRDSRAYEAAMSRPVNKLGSTAREFGQGDLQSALLRGIDSGDPAACLMGRMYVASGGQTLGGQIPADDLEAIRKGLGG